MPNENLPPVQSPETSGLIPTLLCRVFGPSYRTSVAGLTTAVSGAAGIILTTCPHLASGQWDRREVITLVLTLIAGGGVIGVALNAKDKQVSGAETASGQQKM